MSQSLYKLSLNNKSTTTTSSSYTITTVDHPSINFIKKVQIYRGQSLVILDENGDVYYRARDSDHWLKLNQLQSQLQDDGFKDYNKNNNNNNSSDHYNKKEGEGIFKVLTIEASETTCFLLTSENEVYCFSENNYWGQLGLGHKNNISEKEITKLNNYKSNYFNKKVIQILCGYGHTYLITNDHLLYGIGADDYGQMCRPTFETVTQPALIYDNRFFNENFSGQEAIENYKKNKGELIKVVKGWSGYAFGIFLTEEKKLVAFGSNTSCQLGYAIGVNNVGGNSGSVVGCSKYFSMVDFPISYERIENISVCQLLSVILTKDGKVIISGSFDGTDYVKTDLSEIVKYFPKEKILDIFAFYNRIIITTQKEIIFYKTKNPNIININEYFKNIPQGCEMKVLVNQSLDSIYVYFVKNVSVISKHFIKLFSEKLSDVDIVIEDVIY
ncbi:hypothetical protein ABK040_014497 [Willaertia magna]